MWFNFCNCRYCNFIVICPTLFLYRYWHNEIVLWWRDAKIVDNLDASWFIIIFLKWGIILTLVWCHLCGLKQSSNPRKSTPDWVPLFVIFSMSSIVSTNFCSILASWYFLWWIHFQLGGWMEQSLGAWRTFIWHYINFLSLYLFRVDSSGVREWVSELIMFRVECFGNMKMGSGKCVGTFVLGTLQHWRFVFRITPKVLSNWTKIEFKGSFQNYELDNTSLDYCWMIIYFIRL